MVARLESTKDLSCIVEGLEGLSYVAIAYDTKSAFIYRKDITSYSNMNSDIKSVKSSCKFTNQIKVLYGNASSNV